MAHAEQARRVYKTGQLDLTQFLGLNLTLHHCGNNTVLRNRDFLNALRNGDRAKNWVSVGSDQCAVGINLNAAIAGVAGGAIGHLNLEKALTVNRHIKCVAGLLQVALRKISHGRNRLYAGTNLQAGWHLSLLGGLCTGLSKCLIQQIFEHGTRAFKAVGGCVGQVV